MNNPFVPDGRMADGEHFIGREEIIEDIEDSIFGTTKPANMVFIGVNRIGTSSLAYKTICERKDELIIEKGVIPIWIHRASYDQPSSFFDSLVTQCATEVKKLLPDQTEAAKIQDLADSASEALRFEDPWAPWSNIGNFFKAVHKTEYRTLFILDRFDQARHLFEGNTAFDFLRDLASHPDYGVSLVLTSRLSIEEVQRQADSTSLFHGIFTEPCRLGMFSDTDLGTYFSRFSYSRTPIDDTIRKRVLFYCGAHPYLLEMLGWRIVNEFRRSPEFDLDQAADAILGRVFAYYDSLTKLLEEVGILDTLLQILFNPVIGVEQPDVDKLKGYGLIKLTEEGPYVAYSEHFHDYLIKLHERSTALTSELTPIWSQTEQALRKVITITLFNAYGADWIDMLEEQRPNLKTIFDGCRDRQKKSAFGGSASSNLIDFTQPSDVFDIICSKALWRDYFHEIFGNNTNYWEERKKFLAKCRIPIAHSYPHVLTSDQRMIFEGYCREILGILRGNSEVCAKRLPTNLSNE